MAHVVSRGQVTGRRRLGLLPAEATSFVGRAAELAGITALLETARMVTVVGPGGVGKTRVSLRAAALAADQFPDGVWLADLGGISDASLLASTVAEVLGLPGGDVLGYLRGKRLLLILDTCEHQVDACAALADTVLRGAPGVTLLATSRQPLDAQGEHAFPLLPLSASAWGDAVELFAHRAAAVAPGFTVTPQNQADVVRLCQLLDGIPLAIELAAVRLRALPLAGLASQLESGIRLLTVSRRGTSPRHQTLRAAVEWSYQLCTPAEQAAVGAAVGVRGDLRPERGRRSVRGRRPAARAGHPRTGRACRQVRGTAGQRGPVAIPAARRAARVRGGPARGS